MRSIRVGATKKLIICNRFSTSFTFTKFSRCCYSRL